MLSKLGSVSLLKAVQEKVKTEKEAKVTAQKALLARIKALLTPVFVILNDALTERTIVSTRMYYTGRFRVIWENQHDHSNVAVKYGNSAQAAHDYGFLTISMEWKDHTNYTEVTGKYQVRIHDTNHILDDPIAVTVFVFEKIFSRGEVEDQTPDLTIPESIINP